MIDYREIIRLKSADYSNTSVASGTGTEQSRLLPDYEYVYNELTKPGVTLSLLWAEYCIKCQDAGKIAYQHTQFNEKYHAYASSKRATLRLRHKPGDELEVDWVGDTLSVTDPLTGLTDAAYVFVACLPCSMYGFAEAFPDMRAPHWIEAHVHSYEFFGGVTRILVPDYAA